MSLHKPIITLFLNPINPFMSLPTIFMQNINPYVPNAGSDGRTDGQSGDYIPFGEHTN